MEVNTQSLPLESNFDSNTNSTHHSTMIECDNKMSKSSTSSSSSDTVGDNPSQTELNGIIVVYAKHIESLSKHKFLTLFCTKYYIKIKNDKNRKEKVISQLASGDEPKFNQYLSLEFSGDHDTSIIIQLWAKCKFFPKIKIGQISLKLKQVSKDISKKMRSSSQTETIWLGRAFRISKSNTFAKLFCTKNCDSNTVNLHTKITMITFDWNQKIIEGRNDTSLLKQLTASDFQIEEDSAIQSESS